MILEDILRREIRKVPRPFGVFLSGGLDSGVLAAIAKPDFAITCEFSEYSELKYSQKIAKHLKIPLEIVRPQKETFEGFLYNAVWIIGKPINSFSIVPWYCLMGAAQGENMINGEGADELFGGYSRYLILKHIFELYQVPELENYRTTLNVIIDGLHSKLLETEVPSTTDIREVMDIEFKKTLPDIIYMEKKLAEHFNVKFYQPFMSQAVRKYARNLPLSSLISGFQTKVILRRLAEKYLPSSVINRKTKQGLISPTNKYMGFMENGEFNKKLFRDYQSKILKS